MISQDTYAPSPGWRWSICAKIILLTPTPGIYWILAGQMLPAMKAQFFERSSQQKQLKIHFDM